MPRLRFGVVGRNGEGRSEETAKRSLVNDENECNEVSETLRRGGDGSTREQRRLRKTVPSYLLRALDLVVSVNARRRSDPSGPSRNRSRLFRSQGWLRISRHADSRYVGSNFSIMDKDIAEDISVSRIRCETSKWYN